ILENSAFNLLCVLVYSSVGNLRGVFPRVGGTHVNFVQTSKLFSVQALLRTATLTALGMGAFFVTPVSAGVIYTTSFNSINITGTPGTSKASQLTDAGNYTYQTGFNFTQSAGGTLAATYGDIYAYSYSATDPGIGAGNLPTGANSSGTDYGILL